MTTGMSRIKREEGVVLVTAILASLIVLVLSISAVSLAIHNTDASGYDRRRLQAVDAAEAGIDAYYAMLNTTAFTSTGLQSATGSSSCVLTRTLTTTPQSTVTVTPTFYTDNNNYTASCPDATFLSYSPKGPWYVTLSAAGSVVGQTTPTRTMQSRARLSITGSGLTFPPAAMLGNAQINFSSNVQVYGNGANNADLYSNGNISVTTQSNIKGNMYVTGTAYIANGNFQLSGNLWASSTVRVDGGSIGGGLISAGSGTTACASGSSPASASICVSGNTTVGGLTSGGAKTGGTISIKGNCPPTCVNGTLSPGTPGIANPPTQPYPTYTFAAGDWPGYVTATSCSGAEGTSVTSRINSWSSGNLYIRYSGAEANCSLALSPSAKSMPGNLAVLTDHGLTLPTPVKLTNGDPTGAVHTVYFFTGLSQSSTAPTCSSNGNFIAQANSGIGSNLKSIVFTPQACSTTIASNAFNAMGQIFSGTINFSSNGIFTYAPITLPEETDGLAGVYVDIVYKREISS